MAAIGLLPIVKKQEFEANRIGLYIYSSAQAMKARVGERHFLTISHCCHSLPLPAQHSLFSGDGFAGLAPFCFPCCWFSHSLGLDAAKLFSQGKKL